MKWEKFPFKLEKQYRLGGWDYSKNGFYFITICTKDRVNYFGDIVDSKFIISKIGILVEKLWKEIPKHFENIYLDKFVVMPNHMHGILKIKNDCSLVGTHHDAFLHENKKTHDAFLQQNDKKYFNFLANKSTQTIPLAIKLFKSSIKKYTNDNDIKFQWQPRFHDRIIRNEQEFWAKRKYIESNVANWGKEKNEMLYY